MAMATKPHTFPIYPLDAFGGASAAIKRPQVCAGAAVLLQTERKTVN